MTLDTNLDRDGLLALGLDLADVDKLLRDTPSTGHDGQPVVPSAMMPDLLAMLQCAGGDNGR